MVANGRLGGFLAGLGFMLPGFVLIFGLSWLYLNFAVSSALFAGLFYGMQPAVASLVARLVVTTGQMRGWCLPRNDGHPWRPVLPQVFDQYRRARRIHLIGDGSSSHTAQETRHFLRRYYPGVRVLFTPAHASGLNQAELLLRAFAHRYLQRGDWRSRQALIDHLEASWSEYHRLFAHPFTGSWTRHQMHQGMDRHLP